MNLKSDQLEILLGDLNELFRVFCGRHNQTMYDLHPGSYHRGVITQPTIHVKGQFEYDM